jgi:acyl carrier protein
MTISKKILGLISEVAETTECELVSPINDDTVLFETGLDSLGFAILVARLEEELDLDPFAESADAVYPTTFGEFVNIYKKMM